MKEDFNECFTKENKKPQTVLYTVFSFYEKYMIQSSKFSIIFLISLLGCKFSCIAFFTRTMTDNRQIILSIILL